ncbi:hypothetical protein SODALDRAFT_184952 [Sodiomyces alkalinus F11]|uniref:Secreted protein n=1 Tax=Sodiomyces alkalinus (strain CBS 110278 / VKM F-3762 / F11) TaxID=1314773 RepID=A0A3N2PUS1_SODAK|nr:hypothetical protein SODALDRAFT_184952 [Sodiomyces alkalinus F11]ROT38257.1 hypothetical protein SODALDRAFT_184952 [Sodiomyces alkalinus F11]
MLLLLICGPTLFLSSQVSTFITIAPIPGAEHRRNTEYGYNAQKVQRGRKIKRNPTSETLYHPSDRLRFPNSKLEKKEKKKSTAHRHSIRSQRNYRETTLFIFVASRLGLPQQEFGILRWKLSANYSLPPDPGPRSVPFFVLFPLPSSSLQPDNYSSSLDITS